MPHVVTTRHDLLINHVFTIQFITIVPKYCSHCCGHCTCEEIASHKSSMQTFSKSEPFWPAMSARLAHAVSRPHAAPTQRESACWLCGWTNCFHCFLQGWMGRSCFVGWSDWHHYWNCRKDFFFSCTVTFCQLFKLLMILIIYESFEII